MDYINERSLVQMFYTYAFIFGGRLVKTVLAVKTFSVTLLCREFEFQQKFL